MNASSSTPGINPGWPCLSFAVWQVQAKVKACSCGSVVDAVNPADLDQVILPPVDEERGNDAYRCWRDFATANALEAEAIGNLERAILAKVGVTISGVAFEAMPGAVSHRRP